MRLVDNIFATPDSFASSIDVTVPVPNDIVGIGVFLWGLSILSNPELWKKQGTLTPEECAQVFLDIFNAVVDTLT